MVKTLTFAIKGEFTVQATKDEGVMTEDHVKPAPVFPSEQLVPFVLVTALFFLWRIPNNLDDVLIRQFMKSFVISRFQGGLVQSAFYMGYFLLVMRESRAFSRTLPLPPLLVAFGVLYPGWAGLWALFATSFFMSLMFPTIFALGLKGLGPNTKIGGSLIVMAIVGGAILTPMLGLIAEARRSIAAAYVVPLAAYFVIAAYAFAGAKARGIDGALEHQLRV